MALSKIEHHQDFSLAIWRLEESSVELSSSLATQLAYSSDCPYQGEKRRQEHYACRLAAAALQIEADNIAKHPQGWPILTNHQGYLSFSHSREFAAVLYSKIYEHIGIDIESVSERLIPVAKRYLSPQEWEDVQQRFTQTEELTRALCFYWTAKEALFKAVHTPNIDFQQSFQIETLQTLSKEGCLSAAFGKDRYRLMYHFEEKSCYCLCLPQQSV